MSQIPDEKQEFLPETSIDTGLLSGEEGLEVDPRHLLMMVEGGLVEKLAEEGDTAWQDSMRSQTGWTTFNTRQDVYDNWGIFQDNIQGLALQGHGQLTTFINSEENVSTGRTFLENAAKNQHKMSPEQQRAWTLYSKDRTTENLRGWLSANNNAPIPEEQKDGLQEHFQQRGITNIDTSIEDKFINAGLMTIEDLQMRVASSSEEEKALTPVPEDPALQFDTPDRLTLEGIDFRESTAKQKQEEEIQAIIDAANLPDEKPVRNTPSDVLDFGRLDSQFINLQKSVGPVTDGTFLLGPTEQEEITDQFAVLVAIEKEMVVKRNQPASNEREATLLKLQQDWDIAFDKYSGILDGQGIAILADLEKKSGREATPPAPPEIEAPEIEAPEQEAPVEEEAPEDSSVDSGDLNEEEQQQLFEAQQKSEFERFKAGFEPAITEKSESEKDFKMFKGVDGQPSETSDETKTEDRASDEEERLAKEHVKETDVILERLGRFVARVKRKKGIDLSPENKQNFIESFVIHITGTEDKDKQTEFLDGLPPQIIQNIDFELEQILNRMDVDGVPGDPGEEVVGPPPGVRPPAREDIRGRRVDPPILPIPVLPAFPPGALAPPPPPGPPPLPKIPIGRTGIFPRGLSSNERQEYKFKAPFANVMPGTKVKKGPSAADFKQLSKRNSAAIQTMIKNVQQSYGLQIGFPGAPADPSPEMLIGTESSTSSNDMHFKMLSKLTTQMKFLISQTQNGFTPDNLSEAVHVISGVLSVLGDMEITADWDLAHTQDSKKIHNTFFPERESWFNGTAFKKSFASKQHLISKEKLFAPTHFDRQFGSSALSNYEKTARDFNFTVNVNAFKKKATMQYVLSADVGHFSEIAPDNSEVAQHLEAHGMAMNNGFIAQSFKSLMNNLPHDLFIDNVFSQGFLTNGDYFGKWMDWLQPGNKTVDEHDLKHAMPGGFSFEFAGREAWQTFIGTNDAMIPHYFKSPLEVFKHWFPTESVAKILKMWILVSVTAIGQNSILISGNTPSSLPKEINFISWGVGQILLETSKLINKKTKAKTMQLEGAMHNLAKINISKRQNIMFEVMELKNKAMADINHYAAMLGEVVGVIMHYQAAAVGMLITTMFIQRPKIITEENPTPMAQMKQMLPETSTIPIEATIPDVDMPELVLTKTLRDLVPVGIRAAEEHITEILSSKSFSIKKLNALTQPLGLRVPNGGPGNSKSAIRQRMQAFLKGPTFSQALPPSGVGAIGQNENNPDGRARQFARDLAGQSAIEDRRAEETMRQVEEHVLQDAGEAITVPKMIPIKVVRFEDMTGSVIKNQVDAEAERTVAENENVELPEPTKVQGVPPSDDRRISRNVGIAKGTNLVRHDKNDEIRKEMLKNETVAVVGSFIPGQDAALLNPIRDLVDPLTISPFIRDVHLYLESTKHFRLRRPEHQHKHIQESHEWFHKTQFGFEFNPYLPSHLDIIRRKTNEKSAKNLTLYICNTAVGKMLPVTSDELKVNSRYLLISKRGLPQVGTSMYATHVEQHSGMSSGGVRGGSFFGSISKGIKHFKHNVNHGFNKFVHKGVKSLKKMPGQIVRASKKFDAKNRNLRKNLGKNVIQDIKRKKFGRLGTHLGDYMLHSTGNTVDYLQNTPGVNILNTVASAVTPLGNIETSIVMANQLRDGNFKQATFTGAQALAGHAAGRIGGHALGKLGAKFGGGLADAYNSEYGHPPYQHTRNAIEEQSHGYRHNLGYNTVNNTGLVKSNFFNAENVKRILWHPHSQDYMKYYQNIPIRQPGEQITGKNIEESENIQQFRHIRHFLDRKIVVPWSDSYPTPQWFTHEPQQFFAMP